MRRPLVDSDGQPCGCVVAVTEDDWAVEYCPRHRPAWRVGLEAILSKKRDKEE